MYTLIRTAGVSAAARRELTPFIISMVIAELFFRFHSFTLECLAFVAVWTLLSFAATTVQQRWFGAGR
jgi:hypothetical protein